MTSNLRTILLPLVMTVITLISGAAAQDSAFDSILYNNFMTQGKRNYDGSEYDSARSQFAQALEEVRHAANDKLIADAHFWIGEAMMGASGGEYLANAHYDTAIDLYHKSGDKGGETKAILSRVRNWGSRYSDDTVRIERLMRALDNSHDLGDEQTTGDVLSRLGDEYRDSGLCDSARKYYGLAAAAYRDAGNRDEYYRSFSQMIAILSWKQSACYWADSALYFINQAISECQIDPSCSTSTESGFVNLRARALYYQGMSEQAIDDMRSAVALSLAAGDHGRWFGDCWQLAQWLATADSAAALAMADSIVAVLMSMDAEQRPYPWNDESEITRWLAPYYYLAGQKDSGFALALKTFDLIPDTVEYRQSHALFGLMQSMEQLGEYEDALTLFDRVTGRNKDWLSTYPYPIGYLYTAVQCAVALQQWDRASAYLAASDGIANDEFDTVLVASARVGFHRARDEIDQALAICQVNNDFISEEGKVTDPEWCLDCARSYFDAGKGEAAESLFARMHDDAALASKDVGKLPILLFDIGRIYMDRADTTNALSCYWQARDDFKKIRWYGEVATLDSLITELQCPSR